MNGPGPWAGLALAALLLVSCQPEPTTGRNVALLYGITQYEPSNATGVWPNLFYPADDATAVGALLSASRGGVFPTVQVRLDSEATKAQLGKDLQALGAQMGPEDEFLFYYSGHGDQGSVVPNHAVIALWGSVRGTAESPAYNASLTVTEDEFRALLAQYIPTKKVVIILDCCFSGGFIRNVGSDGVPQDTAAYYTQLWKAFLAGKAPGAETALGSWFSETATDQTTALASWTKAVGSGSGFSPGQAQVLSAAGALELSWDDGSHGWGHGAFTHFLLDAKTRGDFDGNGYVTVSEAYRYSFEGLQQEWNLVWGAVGAGTLAKATSQAFLPHLSQGPADYLLFRR